MRTIFIALILISGPAFLGVMGWGLFLIWKATNLAVFVVCCAVVLTAGAGVASVLDKHQPLPPRKPRDQ